MRDFQLIRPTTLSSAQRHLTRAPEGTNVLRAGGIDLLDLIKEGVSSPESLVELRTVADDHAASLGLTTRLADGGYHLGALITLSRLASDETLGSAYRALAQAAGSAALPTIRNVATLGGNLFQRPRCWYFRHADLVCLKKGGSTCFAVAGRNRYHAILGGGPVFIVHPSSLAPPLVALSARAVVARIDGTVARMSVEDLFVSPSVDPTREHSLAQGEVLLGVELPAPSGGLVSAYVAAKEKQSFDWPLAEAAVAVRLEGDTIVSAQICLGHVAPIPWRAREAERLLTGQKAGVELFRVAAEAATFGARPLSENAYKIPVAQGVLRQALHQATNVPLPE